MILIKCMKYNKLSVNKCYLKYKNFVQKNDTD